MTKFSSNYEIGDFGLGKTPKEPELLKAEDTLEKVEAILADVSTGYKVQVQRLSPGWCKGFLETIDVIDNQPVDIDYLIRTWGGEVLRLRVKDPNGKYMGGCDVPLYSYPPLHFGKLKQHPADVEARDNQKPSNPLGDIDQVLSIIERLRSGQPTQTQPQQLDFAALGELLTLFRPQQVAQNPLSGIEQIVAAAEAFKTLRGVFGDNDKPSGGDENMLGQVMSILDAYAKIKSTEEKKPSISPPRIPTNPTQKFIGPVPNPNPVAPKMNQIPQNPGSLNAEQLADLLASLAHQNPDMASDALMIAIDKMPETSREKLLNNFYDLLNDEDEEMFDDTENNMNNIHNATRENGPENSQG